MTDKPWYRHDHQPAGIPRERRAGEEAWRLVDDRGHVQTCVLFDDSRVNAGWDVMVLLRRKLIALFVECDPKLVTGVTVTCHQSHSSAAVMVLMAAVILIAPMPHATMLRRT